MNQTFFSKPNVSIILAILMGIFSGWINSPILNETAKIFSEIFINLLKLISGPIIFLSIFSTVLGMKDLKEFKNIGKILIKYTLLTTWLAALGALGFYLLLNPALTSNTINLAGQASEVVNNGYINYLVQIVPTNFITPFSENAVMSILFLAILLSLATLGLKETQRKILHDFFSSLNTLIMKVASYIVYLLPIAIWSFITNLSTDVQTGLNVKQIALFLSTVVVANLFQGLIVLPIFAKLKGLTPKKLMMDMMPALSFAFFSKSSSATLPLTMKCAEERAGMSKNITKISFPLCTAINMNGCAAFILITVLFVSMSNGVSFSIFEMFLWTFIATIAALGNAGVPMGCYFLSSAFLAAMNIPLDLLAIILPFYAVIDMLETTINVWSDACVVAVADIEFSKTSFETETEATL